MIKIVITNPTKQDSDQLVAIAKCLMEIAGHQLVAAPVSYKEVSEDLEPKEERVIEEDKPETTHPEDVTEETEIEPEVKEVSENLEPMEVAENPVNVFKLPELDSQGLPWDARIHSRTKSKLNNGQWKLARGVDEQQVIKVKAELQKIMGLPKFNSETDTPPPSLLVPPPLLNTAPVVPMPPIAPPPTQAAQESVITFNQVIMLVSSAVSVGKITQSQVTTILKKYQIPSLPLLSTRPDLYIPVHDDITALINKG